MQEAGVTRWRRVEELLDEALERPKVERESYVRRKAGVDKAVIEEVLGILSALDETELSFLDRPAFDPRIAGVETAGASSLVGTRVAHYEMHELLGQGGMGVVYKAQDLDLGRTVAVKFLPFWAAQDREMLQRFRLEALAASSLDHPNICAIHELRPHGQTLYYVMEYVEGETLKERIGRGRLGGNELLRVSLQICEGIAAAHAKGIVHRDIKPSNLMVRTDGVVKILDFGLAKMLHSASLTKGSMRMGSERYMSPEQIRGERVDPRTDLWSFGVVLYEMLAGRPPFSADSGVALIDQILLERHHSLSRVNPRAALDCDDLLDRLLAKDRTQRPGSADDVRAGLLRLRAAR